MQEYRITLRPEKYEDGGKSAMANVRSMGLKPTKIVPDLGKRFEQSTGYAILGQLTQMIIDSDRTEFYDDQRVIEAVEMAPEFFYERFVQPMLDDMANTLTSGFEKADVEFADHA